MDQTELLINLIIIIRLLAPLIILKWPLPGVLICLVLDGMDQTTLQTFTTAPLDRYQAFDKALDIYYLTMAYVVVSRTWTNNFAARVGKFLYFYRLVGFYGYEVTHMGVLLLIFPNVFEYFFIYYEAFKTRWNPEKLSKKHILYATAFIWIFIKLPQEYWIHIAHIDTTDLIKEQIFGVSVDTPWSVIISSNIGVFILLILVVIAVIVGAIRIIKYRLPASDPIQGTRFEINNRYALKK